MNVLITFYFNGPALGVAIYARELLTKLIPLLEAENRSIEVLCSTDAYNYLSTEVGIVKHCKMEQKLNSTISRLRFLTELPFRKASKSLILHLTNPFAPPLSRFYKSKVTSVIHDLNEFDQWDKYGLVRSFFRRVFLASAIKNSSSIICISKHSESQVLKYFPQTKNIQVILNGAGTSLPPKIRNPGKVILVVGRIDPAGKNLWSALGLLDRWHNEDQDIKAVFSGGINKSSENDAQEFLVELEKRSFIKYVGRTSDDELSTLYATSEFLLFFSKFEGFGLPAFEALKSYCPVVAHIDNKALQELLPDEVAYTNEDEGLSISQIRFRINQIDWIKSRNSTMKFSWESAAELYTKHLLG